MMSDNVRLRVRDLSKLVSGASNLLVNPPDNPNAFNNSQPLCLYSVTCVRIWTQTQTRARGRARTHTHTRMYAPPPLPHTHTDTCTRTHAYTYR